MEDGTNSGIGDGGVLSLDDLSPVNAYRGTPKLRQQSNSGHLPANNMSLESKYASRRSLSSSPTGTSNRTSRDTNHDTFGVNDNHPQLFPSSTLTSPVRENLRQTGSRDQEQRRSNVFANSASLRGSTGSSSRYSLNNGLVRSVSARIDFVSSKQVLHLHEQVMALQKRLNNSHALLRQAEQAEEAAQRKSAALELEIRDIRKQMAGETSKITSVQLHTAKILQRAQCTNLLRRTMQRWRHWAHGEAKVRHRRLARLASIVQIHTTTVLRQAFDSWQATDGLAKFRHESEQQLIRLRSCFVRLWARSAHTYRAVRKARAFATWKKQYVFWSNKTVRGQSLIRVIRSCFRVKGEQRQRQSLAKAFGQWSRVTYSRGVEAVRGAVRLVSKQLHTRRLVILHRGFNKLKWTHTVAKLHADHQGMTYFDPFMTTGSLRRLS